MKRKRKSAPDKQRDFHVALSFAGENRAYVEAVADALTEMGLRIFYDKHEVATMWGKDLYTYLREIYSERAQYTVIFVSQHYAQKLWTNHERQSAQARALQENHEYILPARFDQTPVPGLLETTFYIDLKDTTPTQLAQLIKQKLGAVRRPNFLPDNPDRVFSEIGATDAENRRSARSCLEHAHHALSLMTYPERRLLFLAASNACPAGLPENVHLRLDYLARLADLSADEILSMYSRLDCLKIKSRVYENGNEPSPEGALLSSYRVIEYTFEPIGVEFSGNGTVVLIAMFSLIKRNLCSDCIEQALTTLDLSVLGNSTALDDADSEAISKPELTKSERSNLKINHGE